MEMRVFTEKCSIKHSIIDFQHYIYIYQNKLLLSHFSKLEWATSLITLIIYFASRKVLKNYVDHYLLEPFNYLFVQCEVLKHNFHF